MARSKSAAVVEGQEKPKKDQEKPKKEGLVELRESIEKAVVGPTRAARSLPKTSSDLNFHRSMSRSFASNLDRTSERIIGLADRIASMIKVADGRENAGSLEDEDDVVPPLAFQRKVVDVVDGQFERIDMVIDDLLGKRKKSSGPAPTQEPTKRRRLDQALLNANIADRPQLLFSTEPDNERISSWRPLLVSKPHALEPLDNSEENRLVHPYAAEIAAVERDPPSQIFDLPKTAPTKAVDSLESVPLTVIDTVEGLRQMLEELKQVDEIAVDLEHHDRHSYVGFVSLVQISTRTHDYIIDPLVPEVRDALVELNEVLADPKIVKVLHGAGMDIVWLQRDLGLYIVGLFDTFHAGKVIGFPQNSLASLLDRYTTFKPDKRYQLADWRIRPIPSEMLHYARSDTHFLLHIYDCVRAELARSSTAPTSAIREVLARSNATALQVYKRREYDFRSGVGAGGWRKLANKWNKSFEWAIPEDDEDAGPGRGLGFEIFRAVHAWRDEVARELDESVEYVLPNHLIIKLASRFYPLGSSVDVLTIMSTWAPASPVVKMRANELADLVRGIVQTEHDKPDAPAKAQPVEPEPIVRSVTREPTVAPISAALFDAQPVTVRTSTSSTLFGSRKSSQPSLPIASTSSFFGARSAATLASSAAVKGVLSSLSLGFTTAPAAPAAATKPVDEVGKTDHIFVAAKDRQTKSAKPVVEDEQLSPPPQPEPEGDEIIVASKLSKKERKRRAREVEAAAPPQPAQLDLPIVISDDESAPQTKKRKKSKGKKAALLAPPPQPDYPPEDEPLPEEASRTKKHRKRKDKDEQTTSFGKGYDPNSRKSARTF